MNATNTKRLERYFDSEDWPKARRLLQAELKKAPDDHWLLTRLSTTFYEEYKYKEALKISKKALKLAPHCPLVLWDYAGCLDMLRKREEAIGIWKKLLNKGLKRIAFGECGEGIRWTRTLLNDCRYRIGRSYYAMDNLPAAIRYIRRHITNRAPGIPSIYPLSSVRKFEKVLIQKLN